MLADMGNMQDVRGNTVVALVGMAAFAALLIGATFDVLHGERLRRWVRSAPYATLGSGAFIGWLTAYLWATGAFPSGWLLALVMALLVAVILDEKLDPEGRRGRRAKRGGSGGGDSGSGDGGGCDGGGGGGGGGDGGG